MTGANPPRVLILAGPNGAGKTTFAQHFLPEEAHCPEFINADLIAAGLSPFAPERAAVQAGRLMLQQIQRRVAALESFAYETTLSGRGYSQAIPRWRGAGFRVKLIFLRLRDADEAVMRVANRVRQGGHNVPEAVIRRRYESGWENFQQVYRSLVDAWVLYDNSGDEPLLLDAGGVRA